MPALTTQRVLVIEDNAMNAGVLRENLLDAGYSFAHAVNGAAGVALANEQLPDIILMDVNLPLLDGLSATRLLKKNSTTQGIPIVALTAKVMAGDRENCLAAGCDDYISKPVDMGILLAKMRHHLDKRPPAFVDMIRRLRTQSESKKAEKPSGMHPEEYEAELETLNRALERLESENNGMRVQRDAATSLAERESKRAARLQIEIQEISAERERLRAQPLNGVPATNGASRPDAISPSGLDSMADELARTVQHNRQLSLHLELAQARIEELEQPQGTTLNELPALRAENERLRKALLQLHKTLTEANQTARSAFKMS